MNKFFCVAALLGSGTALAQEYRGPPPGDPYIYDEPQRVSFIYSPEVPLTNGVLSNQNAQHNLGIEFSTPTGFIARYHVSFDFVTAPGANGIALEPLTFGWAVPLVRTRHVSFELEPLLSLADATLLFSTNDSVLNEPAHDTNVLFNLSAGVAAQFNLGLGPLYLFCSPVGLELRYLSVDGNGNVTTGGALAYRFRIGIGVQY